VQRRLGVPAALVLIVLVLMISALFATPYLRSVGLPIIIVVPMAVAVAIVVLWIANCLLGRTRKT